MVEVVKATVGRVVHYVSRSGEGAIHYAAIVTDVNPEGTCVSLFVMTPYGERRELDAWYNELMAAGTWHWPERE